MSTESQNRPALVVGIGASAGGMDACQALLSHVPEHSGTAFIVVLHLDPSHESHLKEIFQRDIPLVVEQVNEPVRLQADHVYVISPQTALEISDGMLVPERLEPSRRERRPVDLLFQSLARVESARTAAVVLSGMGVDGSAGLRAVHEAGGICVVQQPQGAQYSGMPSSAVETGSVDAVLQLGQIGPFLAEYARTGRLPAAPESRPQPEPKPAKPRPGFAAVLDALAARYGLDASTYKRNVLERRAARRMAMLSLPSWEAYSEYLRAHSEEIRGLFHDVLVGSTEFFRDVARWEYIEEEVVPGLIQDVPDGEPIRVWSAGCATGEEAYSLAMVFLEQIRNSSGSNRRLQVFATDVSTEALALARAGRYSMDAEKQVAPGRLAEFFHRDPGGYQVNGALRDVVTFAPHNLLRDPPFSRMHFVCCRNVLVYFTTQAQSECLQRLHFALRPDGVLWLGGSDGLGRQTELFRSVSADPRVYRRNEVPAHRAPRWIGSGNGRPIQAVAASSEASPVGESRRIARAVERVVLDRYVDACVVMDHVGKVLHLFGPTHRFLTQPSGEARMDFLSWLRPSLYARLRPALDLAIQEREKQVVSTGQLGDAPEIVCAMEPLDFLSAGLTLISFKEIPSVEVHTSAPLVDETSGDESVRKLSRQLRDSQTELQNTMEELYSTGEEYRASFEELTSLNEELQSSNEELETTKEEVQSVNEELMIVNQELEERNAHLRSVDADLENLLDLTALPIILLDRQLRIRRFSPATDQVFWIVATDVGRSIEHIKKRVSDEDLVHDARGVLDDLIPVNAEIRTDEGRWLLRKIVPFRAGERIEGVCVSYYDITTQKIAAERVEEARYFAEAIVRTSRLPFVVLDGSLQVISANAAFYAMFDMDPEETVGCQLYQLGDGDWEIPELRRLLERVLLETRPMSDYDVDHTFRSIGHRHLRINANLMERPERPSLILLSIEDVTRLRVAEIAAEKRAAALEREHQRKDEFLAMLGHELRNPLGALVSGLTLLGAQEGDPKAREDTRVMLVKQAGRISALLDQLLDVSRVISGKIKVVRERVDLVDVAATAVDAVRPQLDAAGHELEVSFPEKGSIDVKGDAMRLTQVVENLLSNAVKYTEGQGHIWLTVQVEDDSWARISVRDDGVGIDPELLPDVFGTFTQAPQPLGRGRGGLGLGLSIAHLLVKMHGGRIEAISEGPGKGSEFVVHLPRMSPRIPEPESENRLEELATPSRAVRVLVVDDEQDVADALAGLLQARGHQALAVYDGPEALEAVESYRPGVVLLDLGLPKMDGYQVARKLRERANGRDLVIVAVTGYREDRDRLERADFDGHLLKPPMPEKLDAFLARAQ